MKPRSAKAKGSTAELEAARYLTRSTPWRVERGVAGAELDRGDLHGVPDWTIEVKAIADIARAIRDGLADLAVEQNNTGDPHGALIIRRHGKPNPEDYIVVLTLPTYAELITELDDNR